MYLSGFTSRVLTAVPAFGCICALSSKMLAENKGSDKDVGLEPQPNVSRGLFMDASKNWLMHENLKYITQ